MSCLAKLTRTYLLLRSSMFFYYFFCTLLEHHSVVKVQEEARSVFASPLQGWRSMTLGGLRAAGSALSAL